MKVGRWDKAENEKIMIDGREVESLDAFCYLGSLMAVDSSCDREQARQMLHLEVLTKSGRKRM